MLPSEVLPNKLRPTGPSSTLPDQQARLLKKRFRLGIGPALPASAPADLTSAPGAKPVIRPWLNVNSAQEKAKVSLSVPLKVIVLSEASSDLKAPLPLTAPSM